MNRSLDVDLVLREYLAESGDRAPDRVLADVAARIAHQPRRRTWRLHGRPFMNSNAKLALAAAAIVIVAVAGYNLLPRQSNIGGPSIPPSNGVPSTPASTPDPTQAADPLAGAWTSAPATCADQNAALQRAGYTSAELALGGWDAATCVGMTHGSVHRIFFLKQAGVSAPSGTEPDGRFQEYADGGLGWDGYYVLVDDDTFVAGDGNRAPYLTYQFSINGDQLVIDMVKNEFPAPTAADLWNDIVAQTVIYESGPFTRTP